MCYSYLEPQNTLLQLFRASKIVGNNYFEPEKIGSLLFEPEKSETLLFRAGKKLVRSYIKYENCR